MKRFTKILLVVCLCVCTCFGFVACGEPKLSKTTNTTAGVVSNGGSVVKYNGYVYFLNGSSTFDKDNINNVTNGAIYKAKCDSDGNVIVDGDGNPTQMTRVVSSLAGFTNGSIHIFGDFLYYATPNTGKNKAGNILSSQTAFYRLDLNNGATQKIYTTAINGEETVDYAYYKMGAELYLLCYEKNNGTLTSVKVDTKPVVNVIARDVKSVVFGENFGEAKAENSTSFAENYVYYTLAASEDSSIRIGVRVYKVLPNGSKCDLVSEGENVALLSVRSDKLLYSLDSKIYATAITNGDDTLSFDISNVISFESYEKVIFLEEEGSTIALLAYEGVNIRYLKVENGVVPLNTGDNNRIVFNYENTDSSFKFVETSGDYVIYTASNILYKVKYKNYSPSEVYQPEKISTTSCLDATGMLCAEVLDGYIYFYNTNNTKTNLRRATLEIDEDGAGQAVLFGVE